MSPPVVQETINQGTPRGAIRAQRTEQKRETAETLREEEEAEGRDDEDGNTAADRNEELSQAKLSSVGSVAVEAPPPLQSLVWLGESQCRVLMNCKQPDGSYVMAFCGNPANICRNQGHKDKQSRPYVRCTVGYY
ncbi:hypothetical protein ACA910_014412 [Epithemia clementina (nom. ined.)]